MKKIMLTSLCLLIFIIALSTVGYAQNSYEGVVTTEVLNVRSMGTTNSSILGQVYGGQTVKIIGTDNGFYKIDYKGMAAFVCDDYVSVRGNSVSRGNRSKGQMVVETAKKYIGTPYVYGGMSPSGFDCSGFVKYIYSQYGVSLYRTAASQTSNGYAVSRSELRQGDLVFFATNGSGGGISHVGIYVGDGCFIHSPRPGKGVEITPMSYGYYADTYVCSRRIF